MAEKNYKNSNFLSFQYVQTDPPTKESLSQLTIQLLQYQETKLGKNTTEPPMTRLPVSWKSKKKINS